MITTNKTNYTLTVSLTIPTGNQFNSKVGKIPVSTTTAKSCPAECPFSKKNGCYAESGPLAIHWRKVTEGERGTDWQTFCEKIKKLPDGQLYRHNQAGDFPADSKGHLIETLVDDLVAANRGKKGFSYTHHVPTKGVNRSIISHANRNGFTINLSANNLVHADKLKKLGIAPVATVLSHEVDGKVTPTLFTPAGNKVIVCPATYKDNVNCASCQLCQKSKRSVIVGFPAHGSMKKRVDTAMNKE